MKIKKKHKVIQKTIQKNEKQEALSKLVKIFPLK